jgi:hypothetical protein
MTVYSLEQIVSHATTAGRTAYAAVIRTGRQPGIYADHPALLGCASGSPDTAEAGTLKRSRRQYSRHPVCRRHLILKWHDRRTPMYRWVAAALSLAITAVSPTTVVHAGPCASGSSPTGFDLRGNINFSSVPEISKQIVSEEPLDQKQQPLTINPPAPTPYRGPTLGASPRPGRTPIVGYDWSLE